MGIGVVHSVHLSLGPMHIFSLSTSLFSLIGWAYSLPNLLFGKSIVVLSVLNFISGWANHPYPLSADFLRKIALHLVVKRVELFHSLLLGSTGG